METFKENSKKIYDRIILFLKWIAISVMSGIVVGFVGTMFYHLLEIVTDYRMEHTRIITFLPIAGIAIAFLYSFSRDKGAGTNLILQSMRSRAPVPFNVAPLIFISTAITHLFGGSVGREGAAIQIGGCMGRQLGKALRLNSFDLPLMTMCCVSAAFSAVFGTPIAAAIFALEVVSVGVMYYAALLPCALASLTANCFAMYLGCHGERFYVNDISRFNFQTGSKAIIVALLAGLISIVFCRAMYLSEKTFKKISNPYIRIVIGGIIVVALTNILGTTDYNGAGMNVIERAFTEPELIAPQVFLFKILFTAITLGCGFKGGEIVPSFYIGATFGCVVGRLLGISPSLCAAIGMASVFCGVTNCPVTTLIICVEMFGMAGIRYYLAAVAVSYMVSGYYGLYKSQKFLYSKYKSEQINITAHH